MNTDEQAFTVCIPAAGSGSRMNSSTPKQFLMLAGRPVLAHVLSRFDALPSCRKIVIAGDSHRIADVLQRFPLRTECHVVSGGATRQESVSRMLAHCEAEDEIVLVHDAARPCIDPSDVLALVSAVALHDAAILAVPASDTVKLVRDNIVVSTLDRSEIWLAQTPQGARNGLLQQALLLSRQAGTTYTDEASLLESTGVAVHILHGSPWNLKITTPSDLLLAESILTMIADR